MGCVCSLVALLAEQVATTWSDPEQQLLVDCFACYGAEQLQVVVGCLQSFITIHTYTTGGIDASVAPCFMASCVRLPCNSCLQRTSSFPVAASGRFSDHYVTSLTSEAPVAMSIH